MHNQLAKVAGTNGGFRPEEIHRREFQRTTYETLNRQAAAISDLDTRVTAAGEFLADQSVRIDGLEAKHEFDWQNLQNQILPLQDRVLRDSFWGRLRWLFFGR